MDKQSTDHKEETLAAMLASFRKEACYNETFEEDFLRNFHLRKETDQAAHSLSLIHICQRRPFNGNLDGLLHEPAHQTVDFRRHGSGKKQGLLRFRHGIRNAHEDASVIHHHGMARLNILQLSLIHIYFHVSKSTINTLTK